MADPARARKVAERIKVLMAQGIETLVKDPRLGFITITDARVTGDLQQATVFYTVLGGDQERADAAEVLEAYRGRLRSHMGKGLGIRLTPTLEFVPDALPEDAAHMEDIFRQVHERDAELAATRAASGYAGDEDPYRKPREPESVDDAADGAVAEAAPVADGDGTDDQTSDDQPSDDQSGDDQTDEYADGRG
ncbi:30S ribosome-binding factor RbfA [Ornithinimicrobium faecis]|uniref:30S ribosome-binding factor RbfA n=1 Tax=Ornithinimicrobium faecis TaxID=2934158 RepID=UPI002740A94F|nr:30S ribosome-binding factor RbfA [Ornithinimicrobium sp. HY1793]